MNDPLNRLETKLIGMRPAPISAELADRIETQLMASQGRVSSWPDRFLLSAICSGALAACLIVAMLLSGGPSPAPAVAAIDASPPASRLWGAPLAFARAGPEWAELLK